MAAINVFTSAPAKEIAEEIRRGVERATLHGLSSVAPPT
jgi:hypothetical protein